MALKNKFLVLVASWLLLSAGCYSFKDASIDPDIRTFKVNYFENQAATINPALSQAFTERLRDEILTQSNLDEKEQAPDVEFSGFITSYNVTAISPEAGETNSVSRLTITVKVVFTNHLNEKKSWEMSFSRYADFPADQTLTAVESQLVEEINNELADDIFKEAFVNW